MSEKRIIALDLDGTLLTSERTISSNTLQLLEQLQQDGHKVVISTGRPVSGASCIADQLLLDQYEGFLMAYNGGVIQNWQNKDFVHSIFLSKDAIELANRYAKESGFSIVCYYDKYIVSDSDMNPYMEYSMKRNGLNFKKVNDFIEDVTYPISKCMVIGKPEGLQLLEQRIISNNHSCFCVYRSEPYFLEVVPPGIDKAAGLKVLLNHLGFSQSQLIAFGDGYNDISMLRFAGIGVAMSNAAEEVKAMADFIAPSNNEEGVFRALSELIQNSTQ